MYRIETDAFILEFIPEVFEQDFAYPDVTESIYRVTRSMDL